MIKVIIVGKLAKDVELRYTPSGKAVATLTIPHSEVISKSKKPDCPNGWKDSYNSKNWELTTWTKITVWGDRAETCSNWLQKGNIVAVEAVLNGEAIDGSHNPRVWTDNSGQGRASFEFTATRVEFVTMGDVTAD